jgi:enoyl-CoA hydratase/carnithine racemase
MPTGRRCDAGEALRIGLVTDVVEPAALLDTALAKAAEIMLNPPFSVELTKQGMWAAVENPSFAGRGGVREPPAGAHRADGRPGRGHRRVPGEAAAEPSPALISPAPSTEITAPIVIDVTNR